jgi:hypothetical protein
MNRIVVVSSLLLGTLAIVGTVAGCSGGDGANGASAATKVVAEPPGAHCPTGGQAIAIGADRNDSGELDADEITATSYVCNGAAESIEATPIAKGDARCADGGTAFRVGTRPEVVVCNAADGAPGAAGPRGAVGPQGDAGPAGDAGAPAPTNDVVLGRFLPTQLVKGAVLTCATTTTTATSTSCTGLKLDALDVRLGPAEANAVCGSVTGKTYQSGSGMGTVTAPYFTWTGSAWSLTTAGSTSPMQTLDCSR